MSTTLSEPNSPTQASQAKKCWYCNKTLSATTKVATCKGCKTVYHTSCTERAKLNPDGSFAKCCAPATKKDIASMLSTDRETFRGELKGDILQCIESALKPFGERLDGVEASVASLAGRVGKLEGAVSSGSNICAGEELLAELNDREKRAMNVIVFDLKPVEGKNDLNVLNEILCKIPDLPSAVSVRRFVNGREGVKAVKATFLSKVDAKSILRNKVKLAGLGIKVKNDLTPSQIGYLRKLNDELKCKREAGERDLVIRYYNEVPRIVKKKN